MNVMNRWTVDLAPPDSPFLHPQLERLVFEILSIIYPSCIALFDVSSLQEWLSYKAVGSHMFFIVLYLESKYMESQHSEWSYDSWVYPGHSHRSLNGHCTGRLGSWLGHQHFVGVTWFGILEGTPPPPSTCYGNEMTKTKSLWWGMTYAVFIGRALILRGSFLSYPDLKCFPIWWTGAIYYKN